MYVPTIPLPWHPPLPPYPPLAGAVHTDGLRYTLDQCQNVSSGTGRVYSQRAVLAQGQNNLSGLPVPWELAIARRSSLEAPLGACRGTEDGFWLFWPFWPVWASLAS